MADPFEEPFRALTPDGRWLIEVRQTSEEWFTGVVTLEGSVVSTYSTDDTDKLVRWAQKQMIEMMARATG